MMEILGRLDTQRIKNTGDIHNYVVVELIIHVSSPVMIGKKKGAEAPLKPDVVGVFCCLASVPDDGITSVEDVVLGALIWMPKEVPIEIFVVLNHHHAVVHLTSPLNDFRSKRFKPLGLKWASKTRVLTEETEFRWFSERQRTAHGQTTGIDWKE